MRIAHARSSSRDPSRFFDSRSRQRFASSLTRVRPLMGLEMRALGVDLLASGELAFVYPALRVGRTVLVAPRVVPVGDVVGRGRGRARVCVLRAGDRREAVRRDGDQSAKKNAICFLSLAALALVTIGPFRARRDARRVSSARNGCPCVSRFATSTWLQLARARARAIAASGVIGRVGE